MAERWEYRGRWALVTGASAGIGEVFARELARRGMHLLLAARREDRLRALAGELSRTHRVRALSFAADLGEPGASADLWARACAGREIGLLVNNAGFGAKGPFVGQDPARLAEMVRVNCIAPMELAHHAVKAMRGGGIVNVASIAGYQPIPLLAVYAATKAFLITLSEALSVEAKDAGVRIVTLNPGPVKTEFQAVAGTVMREDALGVRTAEEVVAAALHRLERGGGTVTPGLVNRAAVAAVRIAPRSLVLRVARTIIRKLR